jgi:hypothetical protein
MNSPTKRHGLSRLVVIAFVAVALLAFGLGSLAGATIYKVTSHASVKRDRPCPVIHVYGTVSPHSRVGKVVVQAEYANIPGAWREKPGREGPLNSRSGYDVAFRLDYGDRGARIFRPVWLHHGLRTPGPTVATLPNNFCVRFPFPAAYTTGSHASRIL